jgi:DnaJ-class molecular chaperone
MICRLCNGSGSHFVCQSGDYEWWTCPACHGTGVRSIFGPAKVKDRTATKAEGDGR